MQTQSYHFEVKDLVTFFVAAFNGITINRYDKSRTVKDKISVRFVYSPKQRVVHDLINKSQHISLPCVAVTVTSIERDESRIFNKIYGIDENRGPKAVESTHIPSPVPVNLGINFDILTKYQTDMDQILSNFIPYSNPYIILSWPVPTSLSQNITELRSEVNWDGSVSLEYPDDLQTTDPYRVSANTSFTIKGWIWPYQASTVTTANILYINTNITPVTGFGYI